MSGTKTGGLKAAITNKKLHGSDFYKNIGREGGKKGHTGGFAADPSRAKAAGSLGGKHSRKGWSIWGKDKGYIIYKNKETGELDIKLI